MKSGIYKITCKANNKIYIGSSKHIEMRFNQHLKDLRKNMHCNPIIQNSFNKYGETFFIFEIIEECKIEQLLIREQYYLDLLEPYISGFNIGMKSSGGDNLTNHPKRDEIIEKIKYHTNKAISNLTKDEKIKRWSKSGKLNPNFGNKWTDEMKKTLSDKMKGKYEGDKNPFYGKTHTAETKDLLSKKASKRTSNKNPFYGKNHTDETKEKMKQKRIGKKPSNRIKISIDDIIYDSYSGASKELHIPVSTIRWRCLSKNKKYNNYQLLNG